MTSEWLIQPPHEKNASRFERELKKLVGQHAFSRSDRSFLLIEWHRVHDLGQIDKVSAWAKKAKAISG